jgi:hypothetical protein
MAKKKKKAARKSKKTKSKSRKGTRKKAKRKAGRRTVMRSSAGKKLYAVRDAEGKFKDIQTYERAHAADIRRDAADES